MAKTLHKLEETTIKSAQPYLECLDEIESRPLTIISRYLTNFLFSKKGVLRGIKAIKA